MGKSTFVDKEELNLLFFFKEKISLPLICFSDFFYGQSFIKTVRGP